MPKRVDIKTGFLCNNNCMFCVQAHKKRHGNRPTEDIKKDLRDAKGTGCTGVVFTGGESTIRQDILELVRYAKELGFESIQLQTNGRMLAYMDHCRSYSDAGVTEFAPAIHGHTAELHDSLTRSEGSFDQTVKGIRNIKDTGRKVICNTVVVKPNFRHLPEIARLLVSLKVDQFQFAFVHAVGNAYDNFDEMVPRVSEAAPFIKQALQIGIDAGVHVMAEAMPLCTMQGYEKYCSEFFMPPTEIRDVNSYDPSFDNTRRTEGKAKFPQCRECVHDRICEGPWKEYPERYGSEEFQPVRTGKRNGGRATLVWTLYSRTTDAGTQMPNLAITYLGKAVEKAGMEARCIDCNLLVYGKWGYEKVDEKNKDEITRRIVREIEDTQPDIVGCGFWAEGISFIRDLTNELKARNEGLKIVIGGPLTTYMPETVLEFLPGADYAVMGDGEETFSELAAAITKGRDASKIKGLAYRESGKIRRTGDRDPIKVLDDLPLIDFESFTYLGKPRGLHIVTSRGCPYGCAYCGTFVKSYRFHSPGYISRQIRHLIDLYSPRYICFSDDNVLCNEERAVKLLNHLADQRFGIDLPISGRVDNLTMPVLASMRRAKVPSLTVGVESILPKVLRLYNRTIEPDRYRSIVDDAVKSLRESKIGAAFSFVLGSPIETEEDMSVTVDYMKSLSDLGFTLYASPLRPSPGSALWKEYKEGKRKIFRITDSTQFPFDRQHVDFPWVCPANYAFESEHYPNEKYLKIVSRMMEQVSRMNLAK